MNLETISFNKFREASFYKFLLGILLILIFSLSFISFANAQEKRASLRLSPQSGTFFVGNTFDISVIVNTNENRINAVSVDLRFPPDKLQVVTPVAGKSFIESWAVSPTYSNSEGIISFKGGVPSPGIKTSAGLVSTITFRVRAPGTATVYFLDSSLVLLDDGKGTNILKSFDKGEYVLTVAPPEGPKIYSSTHPDQNVWYKDNNPTFTWEKSPGVTDFSYNFDEDPKGMPDSVSEGSDNIKSYTNIADGFWYFHVRSQREGVWGATSTYAVKIDSTPPDSFAPIIESTGKVKRIRPLISFITSDAVSGIDHYEIKITGLTQPHATYFTESTSPYRVPLLGTSEYSIIVRAYDKAGNWRDGTIDIRIVGSKIFSFEKEGILFRGILYHWWLVILILILLFALVGFLVFRFIRHGIGFGFDYDITKLKEKLRKRKEKLQKEIAEEKKELEELKKIEELEKTETEDKNKL